MNTAPPSTLAESKAAQLKTIIAEATERLATELAQGHTAEYRKLLAFWSRFHRYSANNVLLILRARPDATQVAGYHTWKRLGRQVKRGAKAISIWCPILREVADPETGELIEQCVGFTPCPVFAAEDLVDIATNPLPRLWKPLPDDVEDLYHALRQQIAEAGYLVEERQLPPGRHGFSAPDGRIVVATGLDSRNRLMTLLHELAHQLGHVGHKDPARTRDQEELEAESAAAIVCAMLGLEHPTARDYILMYRGTPEAFRASLGIIHQLVRQMTRLLQLEARPERDAAPPAA